MPRRIATPGPVPKEALSYFRNKGLKPSFAYQDVWREEHASAFTVAKALQLDVLEAIRGELDKAIAEGRTLRQFRNDLMPTLQKLGWWGKQEMVDEATGEIVNAQLGSPRRLRTIYNANLRTARAAGQWERAQRTKAALPYFLRTLGPSREHREEHVAWHGTLLPVDHPWWDTHMPPNGWECKCRVRQVSKAEAERLQVRGVIAPDRKQLMDPETGLPTGHIEQRFAPVKTTAPEIRYRDWRNNRTGVVERVPVGIDPGWDTNPGKVRQQNLIGMLSGKIEGASDLVAQVALRDMIAGEHFAAWYAAPVGKFPVARIPEVDATMLGAKDLVVQLSAETASKQAAKHPELTSAEYVMVQTAIRDGRKVQDTPTSLIYLLEDVSGYVVVVKGTKSGRAVFLTSFRRLSGDEAKRDEEIRRLLKKGF